MSCIVYMIIILSCVHVSLFSYVMCQVSDWCCDTMSVVVTCSARCIVSLTSWFFSHWYPQLWHCHACNGWICQWHCDTATLHLASCVTVIMSVSLAPAACDRCTGPGRHARVAQVRHGRLSGMSDLAMKCVVRELVWLCGRHLWWETPY